MFMKNMWEHRATASKPGVVPLKMSTVEGIELLAKAGIVPEAIYVDASHHYKDVIQELTLCLKHFPDAAVCGDHGGAAAAGARRAGRLFAEREVRVGDHLRQQRGPGRAELGRLPDRELLRYGGGL